MILENYMYIKPQAFSEKEIQIIEDAYANVEIQNATVGENIKTETGDIADGQAHDNIRTTDLKWLEWLPDSIEERIAEEVRLCFEETGWNWNVERHQAWQYTIYNAKPDRPKGDFYTWHTDAGPHPYPDGSIRKLSLTLQLSDPDEYEGGFFQWIDPKEEFDKLQDSRSINMDNAIQTLPHTLKQKGSLVLFPSFMHHQVTPVTRGTRKSLVTWFLGPQYV